MLRNNACKKSASLDSWKTNIVSNDAMQQKVNDEKIFKRFITLGEKNVKRVCESKVFTNF